MESFSGVDSVVRITKGAKSPAGTCTRSLLAERGLNAEIALRGKPAPITAGKRWVVERTTARTNAHTKLVWCTEGRATDVAFWIALSAVIIIVGRLVREAWTRYRWATRPPWKP